MQRFVTVIALSMVLAACGGGDALGGGDDPTAPIAAVEGVAVDYYHACGNEVLELTDGRRFYPLIEQDEVDEGRYAEDAQAMGSDIVLAMSLAVVEPGPGDDTGTLTVYEDGMAHFVSDSGIEAWLTDEPIRYQWEC